MEELNIVEQYLLHSRYPEGYTKADKTNLRRKCRQNFKLEDGVLYYRKNIKTASEPWRICVRTDNEKKRILESCHSGIEGMTWKLAIAVINSVSVVVIL